MTSELAGTVDALNSALRRSTGDIIAFTDDDAAPRADWLARIERWYEDAQDVGGVGGRDYVYEGDGLQSGEAEHVGRIFWFGRRVGNHHLDTRGARPTDSLKGVNMSFRREALDGLRFDSRLRGAGAQVHNELDISLAVRARGWTLLYDPAIAVDHYWGVRHDEDKREQRTPRALADAVHNELYVLLKWTRGPRKPMLLAYHLLVGTREAPGPVIALERLVRGADRKRLAASVVAAARGRLAGVRTYLGLRRSLAETSNSGA